MTLDDAIAQAEASGTPDGLHIGTYLRELRALRAHDPNCPQCGLPADDDLEGFDKWHDSVRHVPMSKYEEH